MFAFLGLLLLSLLLLFHYYCFFSVEGVTMRDYAFEPLLQSIKNNHCTQVLVPGVGENVAVQGKEVKPLATWEGHTDEVTAAVTVLQSQPTKMESFSLPRSTWAEATSRWRAATSAAAATTWTQRYAGRR